MSREVYRIRPGWFVRFVLQRRYLWLFWDEVACSSSYEYLAETVRQIGGTLKGPTP